MSSPSPTPSEPRGPAAPALLDGDERERPAFLLAFPEDPELQRLVAAYERGDFKTVRQAAPELAARSQEPAVRSAALELRRRIDPSPLLLWFLGSALALFVVLAFWSYCEAGG